MTKNLLIVESPAKSKTIEKYLGKNFKVMASFGHVRDLEKKNFGIDFENNYEPKYIIPQEKKALIKSLMTASKNAEHIWLATDDDREGEAIAWHLWEVLGLNKNNTKRIIFHEITKNAVENAINNPGDIDLNIVNAQQGRRILDRIVGFELSPLLWRKINMKNSLSAGRVQSVAVRLIVEREDEISKFEPETSYKVYANFIVRDDKKTKYDLKAEIPRNIDEETGVKKFLDDCKEAEFLVSDISVKPSKKTPSAPFTTSTLQQEASNKLGFSVSKTMVVAQKLYEEGHITYMRTNSVNLGEQAIGAIKKEIIKNYGERYSQTRKFKTKSSGAQEAHEAIRPTYIEHHDLDNDFDKNRLYRLIWNRTIASQMADAAIEKTIVDISISTRKEIFVAKGEIIQFDGFLKIYSENFRGTDDNPKNEDRSTILPPLKIDQSLELVEMFGVQKYTKPVSRYTEASLVKKLEELGIGRPSTYAPTITTIQKRDYVVKKDKDGLERQIIQYVLKNNKVDRKILNEMYGTEKMKLFPTDIGILVTNFLLTNFPQILDYNFTAGVENQLDDIEIGKVEWRKMIDDFYKPFHEQVKLTMDEAPHMTGERYLGLHPKTKEPINVRMGKYGPMVVMGETLDPKEAKKNPETKKPKFAGLLKDQSLSEVTLEEAIKLLELPKSIGTYNDDEVTIGIGRFGPYVRNNERFYSIPKDKEALLVTLEEAILLISEKDLADKNKLIHDFPEQNIQVLNGRYGSYIKKGAENFKIPKDKIAKELTLTDVLAIIKDTTPSSKGRRKFTKRK